MGLCHEKSAKTKRQKLQPKNTNLSHLVDFLCSDFLAVCDVTACRIDLHTSIGFARCHCFTVFIAAQKPSKPHKKLHATGNPLNVQSSGIEPVSELPTALLWDTDWVENNCGYMWLHENKLCECSFKGSRGSFPFCLQTPPSPALLPHTHHCVAGLVKTWRL